jgi:Asp-tRNA(Asn)/Glu-tRNA(Gln) amidotransferase A subunit family amidase
MARPDRPNEFLGLRPAPLRGLRVAWTFDLGDLPVQPDVLAVLAACRRSLEDAGCAVTDAAPGLADADEVFQVLRAARMAAMAPLLRAHRDQVKATLAWNIEKGVALTGSRSRRRGPGTPRSSSGSAPSWPTGGTRCSRCPRCRCSRSRSSRSG